MADDAPAAVTATRHTMRELVDGTLEVKFHIDPPQRGDFLVLFSEIGCKCGIVRMQPEYRATSDRAAAPAGEPAAAAATLSLCTLACTWCRDAAFQAWLELVYPEEWGQLETESRETTARDVIVAVVPGITSRKDLDTSRAAALAFHELIREPWLRSTVSGITDLHRGHT